MDKYKLISAGTAAVAAVSCFYAYFRGGEATYGAALLIAAVCFGILGYAELAGRRGKDAGSGTLRYMKPAFFLVLSLLSLAAAVWRFCV